MQGKSKAVCEKDLKLLTQSYKTPLLSLLVSVIVVVIIVVVIVIIIIILFNPPSAEIIPFFHSFDSSLTHGKNSGIFVVDNGFFHELIRIFDDVYEYFHSFQFFVAPGHF